MKKFYTYGEIILILREEYKKSKKILDELTKYVAVDGKLKDVHFEGHLKENKIDKFVRLHVEKEYAALLKKIQYLKYYQYSQDLYIAYFNVVKENGIYNLRYNNLRTLVDDRKYIPKVEILDSKMFQELINELFSFDLMKMERGKFNFNHDFVFLDFDFAHISTNLGYHSSITWKGYQDIIKYSVSKHCCSDLLEDFFSLEIPADKISADWLKLFEKYEHILDKEVIFDVDINVKPKNGILQVAEVENNNDNSIVKLLRKTK